MESWMVRHLFSYYRESGTKTWGLVLNVKLSGRWRGNKEDLFGLEKLKVEESNSHGHGSIYVELSGFQSTDTYCCPLLISCDNPGKEARQLASWFYRWGQQASESLSDLGKGLQYIGSWGWMTPNSALFSTNGICLGASCVPLWLGLVLTTGLCIGDIHSFGPVLSPRLRDRTPKHREVRARNWEWQSWNLDPGACTPKARLSLCVLC